jgi:hypothetical protein
MHSCCLYVYTCDEPLPWSDFFIARGRTLAAFRPHHRDDAKLKDVRKLRDEAQRLGVKHAVHALESALSAHSHQH